MCLQGIAAGPIFTCVSWISIAGRVPRYSTKTALTTRRTVATQHTGWLKEIQAEKPASATATNPAHK